MKPDEREFLTRYLAAWRDHRGTPREVHRAMGMHWKRAVHIMSKIKGFGSGVSDDLGWLTAEGEAEIERKLNAK